MPRFDPFVALRYASSPLDRVIAPPYDVLSDADLDRLEALDAHNIVHLDVPRERDGAGRYDEAGDRLRSWVADGILQRDEQPSFTLYRLRFTDAAGARRDIVGVMGAIEVVDRGSGGVLPHERVTPKASTDRLDLTRATRANLSPVWGLSLAGGLTELLTDPGEAVGSLVVDGVEHSVERVTDPDRIAAISAAVGSDDVLIADGHHRYGVAVEYRDETRQRTGRSDTGAESTLAFVNELVADQLSVEAIHRVYRSLPFDLLRDALSARFEFEPIGPVGTETLAVMAEREALCLVDRTGGSLLHPKPGAFDGVRSLDSIWLETALADVDLSVTYQHGVGDVVDLVANDSTVTAAVLIRPVSVDEIERTAREGLLMPPKSTFFTPKLRTGFVVRPLD